MTTQDIIKQTELFTVAQKQELAYYFLLSTMSEEKRNKFVNLFHYKGEVSEEKDNSLISNFADWKNKLPENLVINEDEFYN